MKVKRNFFCQPTLRVARGLLGKFILRKVGRRTIVGMIVETEAYVGFKDKASHASKGKTPRTAIMFGPPGFAYVYMIYGMYYCFNIVTQRGGYPAAVLIRAVEPVGQNRVRPSGPGKVCQYFRIDKHLNGADVCGRELWVEDRRVQICKKDIIRAKRVGVDYAGPYRHKLWRFSIRPNIFVVKK
ncbi:MAG: DNA-3-methyladenine glycosylase [Patescibacteria group bacterium]